MKRIRERVLLILVVAAGLLTLFYPELSDRWNRAHQAKTIASYESAVTDQKNGHLCRYLLAKARRWNQRQAYTGLSKDEDPAYLAELSVDQSGVMGTLSIPKIRCSLPIYHGTGEEALRSGAGHVSWSSLPVGGASTHTVLSGHRGLPSARLFTDLDLLEIGDTFTMEVLGLELTYQVDQITVVLPEELENLTVVEGEDYCTLVTCTPYGVNTHRLLVRGKRVLSRGVDPSVLPEDAVRLTKQEAACVPGILFACCAAAAALFHGRRRHREQELVELWMKQKTVLGKVGRKHGMKKLFTGLLVLMMSLLLTETLQTFAAAGSITVRELPAGQNVRLYCVGDVDNDGAPAGPFSGSGIDLNAEDLKSRTDTAALLSGYAKKTGIPPLQTSTAKEDGTITFAGLAAGMYLVTTDPYHDEEKSALTTPMLLCVPAGQEVDCCAKVTIWDNPEETLDYTVYKVWDGDDEALRPDAVEISLLQDDVEIETAELSADNNWSHTFEDLPEGYTYTCLESVPEGYLVSMETAEDTCVLTNTYTDVFTEDDDVWTEEDANVEDETSPDLSDARIPQTGQDLLPQTLLFLAGVFLVVLGARKGEWKS